MFSMTGNDIKEIFAPGNCMEGQVVDYIIDAWFSSSDQYKTGERVMLTPGFIHVSSRGLIIFKLNFTFMVYYMIQKFSLRIYLT